MSILRIKSWALNEILTSSDLNAEFDNITSQTIQLASQAEVNGMSENTKGITPSHNKIITATEQAATSGTTRTFGSIPSGVRRITVNFVGVSVSGTSNLMIQIGDSGGLEATGYLGAASTIDGATPATANFTTGFGLVATTAAASIFHGQAILMLEDPIDQTWTCRSTLGHSDATRISMGAGSKTLSAELTQLAVTTVGGANTFDAGVINISYER
jgi:hypothetical protein